MQIRPVTARSAHRVNVLHARRPGMLAGIAAGAAAAAFAIAPAGAAVAGPSTVPASSAQSATPITKVLLIVEENAPLSTALRGMPYLASLGRTYGQATNYWAVSHPSLPNYLAMAAGSTFGITDDAQPSSHKLRGQTVFGQALAAHKTAKVYAETMPSSCATASRGTYLVRHTGWPYFVDERAACARYDVPAGTLTGGALRDDLKAGTLPNVGWLIPNSCNDAHDCSLSTADGWLRSHLPSILAAPDYRSGHLAVIVTFDEGSRANNNVPLVVISPALHGVVSRTHFTAYSLTRAFDEVLHVSPLRNAATATSMASVFHLR